MGIFCFLGGGQIVSSEGTWGQELWAGLAPILVAIFAVLGVVSVGYSVYLGFMLAKAEDEGKRKQAKSRIFKTVSGLAIIVVLVSSMTIQGANGQTFLTNILVGTTDRTHYRLAQVNFTITEVSGGRNKMLVLFKDGYETAVGVEYEQISGSGTPAAGIKITTNGMVTATAAGDTYINVKVNDKIILNEVSIIIRAIGDPPPPPAGQIETPPGEPGPGGVPPGPYDSTTLGRIRSLSESFLGESGYTQSTTEIPTRTTASFNSHYLDSNNNSINRTIRYFDCSSFTSYLYSSVLGVNLSGNTTAQKTYMETKGYIVDDPKPGDWFYWTGHVGIYMGDIGLVYRFGSHGGTPYSNGNIIIHCGGAQGTGFGFYWSNYQADGRVTAMSTTYRQGVAYSQVYKRGNKYYSASSGGNEITFARPFNYS